MHSFKASKFKPRSGNLAGTTLTLAPCDSINTIYSFEDGFYNVEFLVSGYPVYNKIPNCLDHILLKAIITINEKKIILKIFLFLLSLFIFSSETPPMIFYLSSFK